MLRLRKVELFGFKSFADRTSIVFPGSGIAGVVGPNGCGKSNIADSILWVLGEQSAKTLRSGRMSDCIFSGTTERPPTNLAEVSLTLVDPELEAAGELADTPLFSARDEGSQEEPVSGEEPESESAPSADAEASAGDKPKRNRLGMKLDAGEIVVTRRLYRDGKSEYYLNGDFCRLRDIQELFMGTGLGPESYAIIEQGRIGQILSSRPSDRRALLEEAAGVTKYKTQKRLAEAKLAASKQNLLRINDIFEEVTKQLASLKRQASRARRYQEHKGESVALRRVLLATQMEGMVQAERNLNYRVTEKGARVNSLSTNLSSLEDEQAGGQQQQFELESRIRREQNRVGELMVAMERAQSSLTDCLRRQEEARQRLEDLEREQGAQEQHSARTAESLERASRQSTECRDSLAGISAQTEAIAAEAEQLRLRVEEIAEAIAEAQRERTAHIETLASSRAELAQLERAGQEEAQKTSQLVESCRRSDGEIREAAAGEAEARGVYEEARNALIRAQETTAAADAELADCRILHEESEKALREVRGELTDAAAQEKALKELIAQRSAFDAPVRKLLLQGNGQGHASETGGNGANGNGFRSVGVVADFAEFDQRYAQLLQTFLKDELEYVVVDTYDTARSGVSFLRESTSGHATFLVDSFGRVPVQMPDNPLPEPQGQGLIGPVREFLSINGPLGNEAKKVLPRLADTYLVESPVAAEALAADYPRHRFLALDGTCYQGRLVSGGSPKAHTAFELQKEAESASARRATMEPRVASMTRTNEELASRRADLEIRLTEARSRMHGAEKVLVEAEQRLMAATARKTRAERAQVEFTEAAQSTRQQQESRTEREAELRRLGEEAAAGMAECDARIAQLSEDHAQAVEGRDTVQPRLAELQSRRAALEERSSALQAEAKRLEEESIRIASARETVTGQIESLRARQAESRQEELRLKEEVAARKLERESQEQACLALDEERDALRIRLSDREAAVRRTRHELDEAREERSAVEVERARLQSDRQHLENAIQSEFGLTGGELAERVPERLEGEALREAEERDRELRRKLDNIGPVNMMALEEYQECETRHGFLSEQREDLMASMEDIRQTIAELDEVAHKKFAEAFETINRNYQETFKTLFGGGQATLRLTEADDPSEAGVELICQPPGKRLQNVLLLSGGEKALAALSLLIAIFRYTPSPFCILDEVDAPLDDTNIGRFTRLIEEMAPDTQFILVTHSKKTMEAATILYGVTMQNAVSQLVSVRFEEAAAHAAA